MFEYMDNLHLLSIYEAPSVEYADFKSRFSHCLVLKLSGESIYNFTETTLKLKPTQILYIPKEANYSVKKISEGESRYIVINFDAKISNPLPKIYDVSVFSDIYNDFYEINKAWVFNNSTTNYKCLSIFYKILFDLSSITKNSYKTSSQKNLIQKSIAYLEDNIFDSGLNIPDIVKKSNISGTYFRAIFMSIYNTTPKKYINNKRLMRAKTILDSKEFNSIKEVSESVGFDDALYFSKIFKTKYGKSPLEYASE